MHSDSSMAVLLDDRQEWLRFSQPHKTKTSQDSADCWDSHVVIQGMHCAACAFTVEEALLTVPGVRSAEVNAATHRAKVNNAATVQTALARATMAKGAGNAVIDSRN